jgi:hypothetical protein
VSHPNETVDEAVEKAVRKTFAILGVDIDNPASVESFREDLRLAGKLRKAADHGFLVVIGAIAAGICALVWSGITHK